VVEVRYADALRVIGQLVDGEGTRLLEIDEQEAFFSVSWQDASGARHSHIYGKTAQLGALVREAIEKRGQASLPSTQTLAALLRTLGQDLDRAGVHLARIRESGGFHVRALRDGQRVDYCFSLDELITKNRERETPRGRAAEERRRPWWRLRLTQSMVSPRA
jgi:hypothetical protein